MTLQEILKSQGLSEEQIQKIVGEMKQNKIFTASEENLDIRYGKLKGDFDNLTKQHGESTALIEQMKKDNAGNDYPCNNHLKLLSGRNSTVHQQQVSNPSHKAPHPLLH